MFSQSGHTVTVSSASLTNLWAPCGNNKSGYQCRISAQSLFYSSVNVPLWLCPVLTSKHWDFWGRNVPNFEVDQGGCRAAADSGRGLDEGWEPPQRLLHYCKKENTLHFKAAPLQLTISSAPAAWASTTQQCLQYSCLDLSSEISPLTTK